MSVLRGSYMPAKGAERVLWSANFHTQISQPGFNVGLSEAQITAFGAVNGTLQAAWLAATGPTRGPVTIAAKNTAMEEMRVMARNLVGIIQSTPTVTDSQKEALQITIRKTHPTPVPAPETEPFIQVKSIKGRVVTLELRQEANKRGRPKQTVGASIFIARGEEAPMTVDGWQFNRQTTKTIEEFDFGPSETVETIWFSAYWYNSRAQTGPASLPVSAVMAPSGALPQEVEEKETKRKAA